MAHLLTLLSKGRITRKDYDTILTDFLLATSAHRPAAARIDAHIPNNVTIRAFNAVHQVFNTAELLELVLSFLPPNQIIATAPRVCRGWRDAIETSLLLHRLAFRGADSDTPFTCLGGLNRKKSGIKSITTAYPQNPGQQPQAQVTISIDPETLATALACSPSMAATLVCQPPAKRGTVTMFCRRKRDARRRHSHWKYMYSGDLWAAQGITFRDVSEAVWRWRPRDTVPSRSRVFGCGCDRSMAAVEHLSEVVAEVL